jgi:predicted amidohydrolase
MNNLTIAYIQADLIWENSSANLKKFENHFEQIEQADIVVLPEMFNTGFTMNVDEMAQKYNGELVQWMKQQALKHNFAILGSAIINDKDKNYNRFIMAYPCGDIKYYDKRHLFRMGNEHENFEAGSRMEIFKFAGWRIRPLICYDLRFPVWSRNRNNYDVLIYVANWPAARNEVWNTLLKARAIENQCYVIGVNRIGNDGMNIEYTGNSMVIDPRGNIISQQSENKEGIEILTISLSKLNDFRKKFPVHFDADVYTLLGLDEE